MLKNLAFTENATPPTCYIAGSRDSGILTSLRPVSKLIDSNLDFGSFGVIGVKSSFLLKMLLLIQYTLYGHVTYAYKQAWDPLQNSMTQISIWGHLGSHLSKGYFPLKWYNSSMLHSKTHAYVLAWDLPLMLWVRGQPDVTLSHRGQIFILIPLL